MDKGGYLTMQKLSAFYSIVNSMANMCSYFSSKFSSVSIISLKDHSINLQLSYTAYFLPLLSLVSLFRPSSVISHFCSLACMIFLEFLELLSVRNSGGLAHAVNDGHSLDVVVFVLQGPRVEAFGLFGELVTVKVGCSDFAFFVTSNLRVNARHREAAFLIRAELSGRRNGRIHVDLDILSAAIERNYEKAQWQARLRCGQADSLVPDHDVDHLINKPADIVVDSVNRLSPPDQNFGRIMRHSAFLNINIWHPRVPVIASTLVSIIRYLSSNSPPVNVLPR